jgi:hypothetical protein
MKKLLKFLSKNLWLLLAAGLANAQPYSVDWHKVAGGGGTSTNGQYALSGTIAQHDAGGTMTGGGYSAYGGFWAAYTLPTPGAPMLHISQTGPNTVLVWWSPASANQILQTNGDLNSATWVAYGGTTNSIGGTNSVTISPPIGNLFFRLYNP